MGKNDHICGHMQEMVGEIEGGHIVQTCNYKINKYWDVITA